MAEEDHHKMMFLLYWGLYEYNLIPLGLENSPATFQRLMNSVFPKFLDKFLGIYLDNLLVHSTSLEEHVHHLRLVLY